MKARGALQQIYDRDAMPCERKPTPEAQRHGVYVTAGMRFRRVPVIDTLRDTKKINDTEHKALSHYRDQAQLAERSGFKSCLDVRSPGGKGDGYVPSTILSARYAVSAMEGRLGDYAPLIRAVAVDGVSISQWCIARFGGREKDGAIVPANERKHVPEAIRQLKIGASLIIA